MNEQRQIWLRNIGLSNALLRIALGLNICLHGVVRWSAGLTDFAESLVPMFQKTPLPLWVCLQLRLRASYCRGTSGRLHTVRF
jgi:hypothetical protein